MQRSFTSPGLSVDGPEEGSGLAQVLLLVTVISVLVMAVLAINAVQHRFVRQDVKKTQAFYVAEAGIYWAIAQLEKDIEWRLAGEVELRTAETFSLEVEAHGGFLKVRSTGRVINETCILDGLVGQTPGDLWQNAVVTGDPLSDLHLTTGANIVGDIRVAGETVHHSSFGNLPGVGKHIGQVMTNTESRLFSAPGGMFLQTTERLENDLSRFVRDENVTRGNIDIATWTEGAAYFSESSLSISGARILRRPITVMVRGDLRISGEIRFAPGTVLVASGSLRLGDGVRLPNGLVYGREEVSFTGRVTASGQFLSRKYLTVQDDVVLEYPSVLFAEGSVTNERREAYIDISGGSVVEGVVMYAASPVLVQRDVGQIRIGPGARVVGGVFSATQTEISGTVWGSIITNQFYLYDPPDVYIHWMKDVTVDRTRRPSGFVVPIGMSESDRLVLVSQNEVRKESTR